MKARAFLLVSLAFLIASCVKEDKPIVPENEEITTPGDSVSYESFYYCVNVNKGQNTKVTIAPSGVNEGKYVFEEGDALYVISLDDPGHEGTEAGKVWGKLEIASGEGETSASFSGTINKEGGFDPYDDLPMKATLVSEGDKIHEISSNKVTATVYPKTTNSIAPDLATAVSWYGDFTGTSTYSAASYSLSQNTAFITITATFESESLITTSGKSVNVSFETSPNAISNDRSAAIITTMSGGKAIATGVTGVPGGSIVLDYDNLTVSWDTDGVPGDDVYKHFSFSGEAAGTTLTANKQYNFSRTVEDDYYNDLFTIEAKKGATTISFRKPENLSSVGVIEYSTDEGETWTEIINGKSDARWGTATLSLPAKGDRIHFRGTFASYQSSTSGTTVLVFSNECYAYGDIMYMVGSKVGSTFTKGTDLGAQAFNRFFRNNTKLYSKDGRDGKSELCKLEIGTRDNPPSLNQSSCKQMFNGCSKITMAPELWATTIDLYSTPEYCETPASNKETTIVGGNTYYYTETAYSQMFLGCTNLLFAPMIAITTPKYNTLGSIFQNCANLRYIQCLAKVKPEFNSTFSLNWVNGVTSTSGYFIYNKDIGDSDAATAWWGSGNSGIPSGAGWILIPSE